MTTPLALAMETASRALIEAGAWVSQPEHAAGLACTLVALLTGALLHRRARARARVLPYVPSLTELFEGEHDETTRFLASVHDMTMAITDAWNATRARSRRDASVEAVVRTDALLPTCDAVVAGADAVLGRFADFGVLAERALAARSELEAAWDYQSRDNYRTEVYTTTSTDAEGNTTTETRTREVYENTDHYFTFRVVAAESARSGIGDLLAERDARELVLPVVDRLEVRLEQLDPAQRSFLDRMVRHTILEEADADVTEAEVVDAVSQWILGARIDEWLQGVIHGGDWLAAHHAGRMATVLASDVRYHYCTTSRSHGGPPGYRAARELRTELERLVDGWSALTTMVHRCASVAADLSRWAEDRSEDESDTEYVKAAARAYGAAFPGSSLEIDQLPRHGRTIGLALAAGVAAGVGVYFAMGGRV